MFDSVEVYDGTIYYMVEVSDETFKYIPKHGECTTNLWELYGELEDYIVNEIMSTIEYKDYVYDLPTFFLDFCKEASLMQYIEEVEDGYKIKHNIIQHFIFNWEVRL